MDNVTGETEKKRGRTHDRLLLWGAGFVVATFGTAAFWLADTHHISPAWPVGALAAISFFIRQFRLPTFALFAVAWLLVHVFIFLFAMGSLGLFFYLPFLVAELWIGFMAAIWLFGPPSGQPNQGQHS
jgi:hypothetical protein